MMVLVVVVVGNGYANNDDEYADCDEYVYAGYDADGGRGGG